MDFKLSTSSKDYLDKAIALHKTGEFSHAEAIYRTLLNKSSRNEKVNFLLGLLLFQTKRPMDACFFLEKYLGQKPFDPKALEFLALTKFEIGQYEEAKNLFINALKHTQQSASLYYNLGQTHFKLEEFLEANESFSKAISLEKNYCKAYIGKGLALKELGKFFEASDALTSATLIDETAAESFFFLGNVTRDIFDLKASIKHYQKAINLQPNYIEAIVNCGNSYKDLGLNTEAIHYYDTSLQLDENHPEANYNKSLVLLSEAQFESGWPLYEWRFNSSEAQQKFIQQAPITSLQTWDGLPLDGRLLVLPEQGIGDQIFFSGMLNDLRNKVSNLTVCADSRLISLFDRSYPDIDFVDNVNSVEVSQFKAQIHFGSLGQFLRPNVHSFTGVLSPYLSANTEQSYQLRSDIKRSNRLLCGISWLSKNADHGLAKSLSLASLEKALKLPGFDFIDLQYGDTRDERAQFFAEHSINIIKREEIDNFSDIDGLASLIAACDLVVTVSNTTAHLACALGKPTLVLLPQHSAVFWYWHNRDMHSPWYPTAVLLRQQELGGWSQVIQTVCQILEGMQ